MKRIAKKIIQWAFGIASAIILLLIVMIEGIYFFGLRALPENTQPTPYTFSLLLTNTQWVVLEESEQIELTRMSPVGYIVGIVGISSLKDQLPTGSWLAALNARELLSREENSDTQKYWHLNYASVTIWVTNNWSVNQSLNNFLSTSSYGNEFIGIDNASHGYFGKKPIELDPYESSLLVGLQKSPSRYDPWCRKEKALENMNKVVKLLSDRWPSVYGHLSHQKELPSSLLANTNECKT